MAKRPPPDPFANGPNGERDERGRFRKGWAGGPGSAKHKYVQDRARLFEVLREEFTTEKLQILCRALFIQAINGEPRAAQLLLAYRLGKPPEAMSPRELFPLTRIPAEPTLSIEALSARLQRLLEDFEAGRVSEAEARMCRDILSALITARQTSDLERKLDEFRLALGERSDNGQPS